MNTKNIVVAINHFLLREGFVSLLSRCNEYAFKGVVDNKEAICYVLDQGLADLVVIDYASIDMDTPNEVAALQHKYASARLLLLVNGLTHHEAGLLTSLGIRYLVSREADEAEILNALEMAFRNKKYFSDAVLDLLLEKKRAFPGDSTLLTPAETDIVRLISDGLTTKEIAARKNISFHTVMTHRKNIFKKLRVTNVSELMRHAIRAGWIDNIEYYI